MSTDRTVRVSNPGGGEFFRTRPDRPGYWLSLPGVKRPEHGGVDHPPPYSAKVKERVELYLSYSSGPSRPVLGQTFILLTSPTE